MRSLFKSKSKFLAGICCLCLGIASLFAGAFSFAKAPASADEVADTAPGFYVEQGASIRYDDVVPGIRFEVSLTKAQWETFYAKGNYADDVEVVFKAEIHFANRLNQNGETSEGYRVVDHTVTVKTLNDYFDKAENVGKPFTVKPAILLSNAWKDAEGNETPKSQAELYRMYADMEFYLTGAGIFVNEEAIAVKTVNKGLVNMDYTLRSVRSVAASLLAKGAVAAENVAVTESFIKNEDGTVAEIVPTDIKSYYDKYVDSGKVDVSAVDSAILESAKKVTIGATKASASAIVDGEATITGSASTLTDGKTYIVNYDCGDKIYSFQGLTAATEIFYQANGVERLNARFAMTATATEDLDGNGSIGEADRTMQYLRDVGVQTETVVKDGVEYSMDFYGVDRGYYVLGSDIDFGGNWSTTGSSTNAIMHGGLGSILNYSGLMGFGGTFDGNGHTIKNIRFNRNLSTGNPSGLFGMLAYGATVKDVAFVDAIPKNYDESHRGGFVLAATAGFNTTVKTTGSLKSNYDYLVAKYGSTDCVLIDNCYFGFEDTLLKDTSVSDTYSSPYSLIWDRIKDTSGASATTDRVYPCGSFGILYEGHEDFVTFRNSVLYNPASERLTGTTNNGAIGWISRGAYGSSFYYKNGNEFENCYQISADMYNGKVIPALEFSTFQKLKSDGTWGHVGNTTETDYLANPQNYKASALPDSWDVYASNQYEDIENGTEVYSGLDADGKWVVEVPTEDNGYTANKILYHYNGVKSYNSYVHMSANNTDSLEGFNSNWVKVGGAIIWKGLADATAEKTLTLELSSEAIGVGDTIEVTALYGAQDVTEHATLSTDNASVITINNVDKTFKIEKGGEATLYVTAGEYSAEYTIVATSVNETAVVISSNYSAVYGSDATYSVPYFANGNDLVKTDFLTLYREQFGKNDATISAVYLLDETGAKTALDAINVEGVSQYLFANAGNVKQTLNIIIDGSEGYMGFADISTVTAVVADEYGFKYIPTDATTRAGYYVLANDFDNMPEGVSTWNRDVVGKLGEMGSSSNQLGYSFGGLDFDRLANINKGVELQNATGTASKVKNPSFYAYQPFTGTFDGLGHTIDNLLLSPNGLLGAFNNVNQTALLKNVKLTNVRNTIYYWNGDVTDAGLKKTLLTLGDSDDGRAAAILAVHMHATQFTSSVFSQLLTEDKQIKIQNVVIEMATSGHRSGTSNYGGASIMKWSLVRYERYVADASGVAIKGVSSVRYLHRIDNKYNIDGLVFKYQLSEYGEHVGYYESGGGGGYLFSFSDSGATTAVNYAVPWSLKDIKNVYMIASYTATGRMPFVAGCLFEATISGTNTTFSQVVLAQNDFESLIANNPDFADKHYEITTNGTTYYSTVNGTPGNSWIPKVGVGYTTTTVDGQTVKSATFFVPDIEARLAEDSTFTVRSLNGWSKGSVVQGVRSFYRYDTYAAMATAGVTQVGNFAITADGIVWNPAN